jgi:hypothetical protein
VHDQLSGASLSQPIVQRQWDLLAHAEAMKAFLCAPDRHPVPDIAGASGLLMVFLAEIRCGVCKKNEQLRSDPMDLWASRIFPQKNAARSFPGGVAEALRRRALR